MHVKILLAVDDRGLTFGSLPDLILVAKAWGAQVAVMCTRCNGAARALVDGTVEALDRGGVPVIGELLVAPDGEGERDTTAPVMAAAAAAGADLVALGARQRGDSGALVLGRAGRQAALGLPLPVLLVPGSPRPGAPSQLRCVLACVDGGDQTDAVLRAAERAAGGAAEVVVVHPSEPRTIRAAEQFLEQAIDRVRGQGVMARGSLLAPGAIASRVLEAADRYDAGMVVIGPGRSAGSGALRLGSIAHRVLGTGRRPVLLARHSENRHFTPPAVGAGTPASEDR